MSRSTERLALVGILAVAAAVRLYRIDLTWYFLDQVRDVSTAIAIVTGAELPLVGPLIGWTSGRLGPLYFYLIAPPFAITRDPLAGFVFVALASVLAVFLCHRLTRRYFGAPVALVATALFAVFPLGVFSARVLWNPALVPLFTLLFMSALYRLVLDGQSRAVIGLLAWLAVLTQIHLSTVALGAVAALALLIWRPRVRLIHALAGAAAAILLYAPYLFHELSHRLENLRAILAGTASSPPGGERALPVLARSVLLLYRSAVDGFVVDEPWPRLFLGAFSILYRIESLLFCAGIALCLWQLARGWRDATPEGVAGRRARGLLLLWLAVPVAMLGMRKTALWWYYLDLLYPSQFILAGLALCAVPALGPSVRARRTLARGAVALVLAIVIAQAAFQVGLQRRVAAQGQLVFDVPRFSVAAAGSPLAILPSLPYGYRARLLQALVADLGLPAEAVTQRAHGPVLGRPDENALLLRHLGARAPQAGAPGDAHYLVTRDESGSTGLDARRSTRVGPYAVVEYRPVVDYRSWRCVTGPAGERPPAGSGEPVAMPATSVVAELQPGRVLACTGQLRVPEGRRVVDLVVSLIGMGRLHIVRAEVDGRHVEPRARHSWQSPSLYWVNEAGFELTGLRPGEQSLSFLAEGAGLVMGVDVYERRIR